MDRGQRRPRSLERAVDGGNAGVEQLGNFRSLPAQDLREDEHRSLASRQMLERRDEGQPNRLPGFRDGGGVAVLGEHSVVGDGGDPRVLRQHRPEMDLLGRR